MDPQHPGGSGPSRSLNDAAGADISVGRLRGVVGPGLAGGIRAPAQLPLPVGAQDTDTGANHPESAPEDAMIRDSWVSLASTATSRNSTAQSVFSVRASTASVATRYSARQSSIESPTSATSPLFQEHRKGSFPQRPHYCCTFCEASFDSKTEWKVHELEYHDRGERYPCRNCDAAFTRVALLTAHVQVEHGLEPAVDISDSVQHSVIRSAWGCGFCAEPVLSRNDYLEHVGRHYDEGKVKLEWQHTRVIEALLHQPGLEVVWTALIRQEEDTRGAKLRLVWDPRTTGRADEVSETCYLQDVLEFFATSSRTAEDVAAMAYRSAQVRLEGNVSDLISKLHLRTGESRLWRITQKPPQLSPEPQPSPSGAEDDVVSPISPLPAPLRPPIAAQQILGPSTVRLPAVGNSMARDASVAARMFLLPPLLSGAPSDPSARVPAGHNVSMLKGGALRRIESARNLTTPQHSELGRHVDRSGLVMGLPASTDRCQVSSQAAAQSHPHSLGTLLEPTSTARAGIGLLLPRPATASSVRQHTSSSTLSTRAGDDNQRFDDSTSEALSDDSLSEPDSWPGFDVIPLATKNWKSCFQQTLDQGMRRLWSRYNRDWDGLVRQCMGGRSGDCSQLQDSSGRVRKTGSARQTFGKGLHPNTRPFGHGDDDDDDDEGEAWRPSSSLSKRSSDSVKRFACPFRKHDPHIYNISEHEVCAIRSWSTISRLKEHLYRRHYKTHCQRCKQTFSDAKELAAHEMSIVGCEVLDVVPPGDITTYQEKQLKSRKHTTRRQTDEEKWRDIYRLLFPGEDVPSPYPEPAEDLAPASSESRASLNFQHFLLAEMPALFTKTAEEHAGRHLQAHEGLPMNAIPRIIEDALQKAFRTWEARGSELPTRETSVTSMSFMPDTPSSVTYSYGQPATYQTPQHTTSLGHTFPHGHFPTPNQPFTPDVPHTSHADDSGFADGQFFTSGPPVDFDTFAPHFDRGPWDGLMGSGAFPANANMGGQFRGFQGDS